ncbi:hypothetical protein QOT17_017163 [Balamuthia mandrillaris]
MIVKTFKEAFSQEACQWTSRHMKMEKGAKGLAFQRFVQKCLQPNQRTNLAVAGLKAVWRNKVKNERARLPVRVEKQFKRFLERQWENGKRSDVRWERKSNHFAKLAIQEMAILAERTDGSAQFSEFWTETLQQHWENYHDSGEIQDIKEGLQLQERTTNPSLGRQTSTKQRQPNRG